jgi:hypothetical protein
MSFVSEARAQKKGSMHYIEEFAPVAVVFRLRHPAGIRWSLPEGRDHDVPKTARCLERDLGETRDDKASALMTEAKSVSLLIYIVERPMRKTAHDLQH